MRIPIGGIEISHNQVFFHLRSVEPLWVLGSAVVGGELERTRHILNMHVPKGYFNLTPEEDLSAFAKTLGLDEPFVGLMTAAAVEETQIVVEEGPGVSVAAAITVGLGNPSSAGKSLPGSCGPSTINIVLLLDACMARSALVGAIVTATEAKALALFERGVQTPEGHPASGTSTDAIVVACTGRGEVLRYAGPATEVGWLIGRAVRRGVLQGIQEQG